MSQSILKNIIRRISDNDKSLSPISKIKRYVLYAIGEIILVVLGILIALHFNSLNEEKKLRSTEIKILKELNANLESTKEGYKYVLETEKRYLEYNNMILDYLENKKTYSDSLDIAFGTYFWTISSNPITSGYEYFKSVGLGVVKNDTLREKISYMFESDFKIIKSDNEKWANNLQLMISYPFQIEHFKKYFPPNSTPGDDEYAKPIDYNFLLEDAKFKNINAEIISTRRWIIFSLEEIIQRIDSLKWEIKNEIERLNKK